MSLFSLSRGKILLQICFARYKNVTLNCNFYLKIPNVPALFEKIHNSKILKYTRKAQKVLYSKLRFEKNSNIYDFLICKMFVNF